MKTIDWNATKKEQNIIEKIAARAIENFGGEFIDTVMDITACHLNGTPLRLQELLEAPMADFGHDINGIARFMDRETGELSGYFLPRFFDSKA